MYQLHCTKKLLDRIKPTLSLATDVSTQLGNWYATALFWRPQVALLVNERTLLPILMPLAPATSLLQRFPEALAEVLAAHGISSVFIESEVASMQSVAVAKTANRSVVGVMNEFAFLAGVYHDLQSKDRLVGLSLHLAKTPCLSSKQHAIWPDKALQECVAGGGMH